MTTQRKSALVRLQGDIAIYSFSIGSELGSVLGSNCLKLPHLENADLS